MSELPIEQMLRSMRWKGNKRTLPRMPRVAEEVLSRAQELREAGKFAEAADLLLAQPPEMLEGDPVALNGLGHFRFGADDYEGALAAFEMAGRAAARDLARARINAANALKVMKRYDEAERKATEGLALEPSWFVSYLMLIAIHECRATPADRALSEELLTRMQTQCPGCEDDPQLWQYLLTDVDYARLRSDTILVKIFGRTADEARRSLSDD